MKIKELLLLFLLYLPVLSFAQNESISDSISTSTEKQTVKRWQFAAGYSINNPGIFNTEIAYIIPFNKVIIDLSVGGRIYSFPAFNLSLLLHPIQISDKFNISFGAGFGVSPSVLFGIIGHSFVELFCIVRYELSENYSLFIQYKRVGMGEGEKLETFTRKYISHFPIQFLSIGIEL